MPSAERSPLDEGELLEIERRRIRLVDPNERLYKDDAFDLQVQLLQDDLPRLLHEVQRLRQLLDDAQRVLQSRSGGHKCRLRIRG